MLTSLPASAVPSTPPAPPRTVAPDERVEWVDTAKGICIILVVMMHATLGVGNEMGGQGFMHWVVAFAKPFRMPDFFLISGLFLGRVIGRDWGRFADRRVLHFLYFYVLWLVIQSAFKYGQVSGGTPGGFLRHIAVALYEPYSTLWFIYILAVFSVVTKILRTVSPAIVLAAAAALQILPVETGSFLYNEFCERWVYFLVGYLFAPPIFAFAARVASRPRLALGGIAIWAGLNAAGALTPSGFHGLTVAELPVFGLLFGLAGALAIVAVAALVAGTRLGRALRVAGSRSIAVYLAFFLPMALTRSLLIKTGIVTDIGLVSLIVTMAGVAVPLALDRLVRRTPLFFLFERPAWLHIPERAKALQPATAA